MKKVSFVDFKRRRDRRKIFLDATKRVLSSGYYILGPEVKTFENNFATYTGAKHAIGVGNGLEALQIALMALGIGEGDEVITTPFSAIATTLAIRATGATPIFVDIDKHYHIDASLIESKVTKRTKAILPVHLYGAAADMQTIMRIARKRKLYVIEDAAQAHGAAYRGKRVGTFGEFGCFSFYPTKNLGGIGDGGALLTNNDSLAEKCRMLRNYGQKDRYHHAIYGLNSRLDELQAAFLTGLLPNLDRDNTKRRKLAALYTKELANIAHLELPKERTLSVSVYHLYAIATEKRDALQTFLTEHNVETLIHYPLPIHKQECLPDYNNLYFPRAEHAANTTLSLPLHPYLTKEEVLTVCAKIREFFK